MRLVPLIVAAVLVVLTFVVTVVIARSGTGAERGQAPGCDTEMTRMPVPERYWRNYGNDPLPTGAEALDEPFAAFLSWFSRPVRKIGPRRVGRGTSIPVARKRTCETGTM